MPKLKRHTSQVVASDVIYQIYDGPEPRDGIYPGVITNMYMSVSGNGNNMLNISGVLHTKGVEGKEQYDGWRGRGRVVFVDKELNLAKEQSLYSALGVSKDPEIIFDSLKKEEKPGTVTKIGGKSPLNVPVKFQIKTQAGDGDWGPQIEMVLPMGSGGGKKAKDVDEEEEEVEEVDEDNEDDEDDEDDEEEEVEIPDYKNMGLADLRKLAKSVGITSTKKADIIDELTDYYADNAEPEDDEEDEEDEGHLSSEDAKSRSLEDLQSYATDNGIKKKKILGMKKAALIKFLTTEGLIGDEPPF